MIILTPVSKPTLNLTSITLSMYKTGKGFRQIINNVFNILSHKRILCTETRAESENVHEYECARFYSKYPK